MASNMLSLLCMLCLIHLGLSAHLGRRSCSCTLDYRPVCASFYGQLTEFSNSCFAECAGATVVNEGPCSQAKNKKVKKSSPPDCFCPYIYDTVCGTDGVTYGSECIANCYGATVAYEGECTMAIVRDAAAKSKKVKKTSVPNCGCPLDYRPVCTSNGLSFSNACIAACYGIPESDLQECD